MPYPNWSAGQRITAALLNAGNVEFVTNSAGAQTNATTTMAAITGLVFAAEANARYKVQVFASYDAPTATDIKFDWVVPAGATMNRNVQALAQNAASNEDSNVEMIRRGATTDQGAGGPGTSVSAFSIYVENNDLIMSSTAGDVQFNFAAAAAGTATLQADSIIYYQRIA